MAERRTNESGRRAPRFTEKISLIMVSVAAFGAFWVLVDPKVTVGDFQFGGVGFSADLKGAVIGQILIAGFSAVKEFWLGASASGNKQGETVSRIAEQSAPVAAAAVAAAISPPAPTADTVRAEN